MKRLTKSDTVHSEVVLIQFAMRFATHTQKKGFRQRESSCFKVRL